MLSEPVREFWTRLAVFHGGWTLDQASQVLEEPRAIDYLEELCDSSLVYVEHAAGGSRYGMYEPIRRFVLTERDQLLATEDARRHAGFFAEMVTRHFAEWAVQKPFSHIDIEQDNIRACLEWAFENDAEMAQIVISNMRSYWCQDGHYAEARRWFARALAIPERLWAPKARCSILFSFALIEIDQGQYWSGKEMLEAERKLIVDRNLALETGWLDLNIAYADFMLGDLHRALSHQERALAQFQKGQNHIGTPHALSDLGITLLGLGLTERGLQSLRAALDHREEFGYVNGIVSSQAALGRGYLLLRHYDAALTYLRLAREGAIKIREVRILAEVLRDIAFCELARDNIEEVDAVIDEMHALCRRMGNLPDLVRNELLDARLAIAKGDSCSAMSSVREAVHLAVPLDASLAMAEVFDVGVQALLAAGRQRESLAMSLAAQRLMLFRGLPIWPSQDRSREQCQDLLTSTLSELDLDWVREFVGSATAKDLIEILVSQ